MVIQQSSMPMNITNLIFKGNLETKITEFSGENNEYGVSIFENTIWRKCACDAWERLD